MIHYKKYNILLSIDFINNKVSELDINKFFRQHSKYLEFLPKVEPSQYPYPKPETSIRSEIENIKNDFPTQPL